MHTIRSMICVGLFMIILADGVAAKRLALVIGNDGYAAVPVLQKAVNDAEAMAGTLKEIGFEVILSKDASRRDMNRELQAFTARLEPGDEALFFYAGHGLEIAGRNYLLPVDVPAAKPGKEDFIKAESIPVDQILDSIRSRGTRISILVLDACRNNPFPSEGTRSLGGSRGLARMPAPEGSFIMYSAGVGQTALDRLSDNDPNPNSVFTRSLIPLLKRPGFSLTKTARQVRRDVQQLASVVAHEQRPAYYDEVTGDFFFSGSSGAAAKSEGGLVVATPGSAAEAWTAVKDTNSTAVLEAFIAEFPTGLYSTIAKERLKDLKAAAKVAALPSVTEVPADTVRHSERPRSANEDCSSHGDVRICASSVLAPQGSNSYRAANLTDGQTSTAWVEGKSGHGVGEWIVVEFDTASTVRTITLRNGYTKSRSAFEKNSRVKEVEIRLSSGKTLRRTLKDTSKAQSVLLDAAGAANWLQLRIVSVYPGSKYQDTAISELRITAD